jgi:FAD/FMN-containing dehydrogenase
MSRVRERLEALLGQGAVSVLDAPAPVSGLPLALPASEEELVEALKLAASERWSLVPIGLGSKLSWRRALERPDFALSTRKLTGVVAYEPGDGTLTARAGTTIESLSRTAREGGNHFTPRVPRPDGATLGGALAAGQSGIDRLRCGPSRHHVLGMRVALADGSVAKSGGRLVKNVTGYDMHRLYCGSHGTLCVILEASMRLFAGFEREILVTAPARDREGAIEGARAVASLGLQPLGVLAENVLDPDGAWRVHALLAGCAAVVEWGRRVLLETLPGAAEGVETIERVRDAELTTGRWPDLRVTGRPSRLLGALERIGAGARMTVEPTIASAGIHADPLEIERIARDLRSAGLQVRVRGPRADPLPEAAPGHEIARRLKLALDPEGRLIP